MDVLDVEPMDAEVIAPQSVPRPLTGGVDKTPSEPLEPIHWLNEAPQPLIGEGPPSLKGSGHVVKASKGHQGKSRKSILSSRASLAANLHGAKVFNRFSVTTMHGLGGLGSAEGAVGMSGKHGGGFNADFLGRSDGNQPELRGDASVEGLNSFEGACAREFDRLLETVLRLHATETASLVSQFHYLEVQNRGLINENQKLQDAAQQSKTRSPGTHSNGWNERASDISESEDPIQEIPGAVSSLSPTAGGLASEHEPPAVASQTAPSEEPEGMDLGCAVKTGTHFIDTVEIHEIGEDGEEDDAFELWEGWTKRQSEVQHSNKKSRAHQGTTFHHPDQISKMVLKGDFGSGDNLAPDEESATDLNRTEGCSCLDPYVLRQTNPFRLAFWDPASFLLVAYECIYIPLQFFSLREGDFQKTQQWISRCFWTIDLPLSFLTGYQAADGQNVLSASKIIRKYMQSWFIIDISLVILDWVEVFALGNIENLGAARIGKTFKALRLLRMLRVARILQTLRLPESLSSLMFLLRSEILGVVLGIMKIVLFVLILNHFLACIWYGLAHDQRAPTWLSEHNIDSKTFWYKYWTSYHWSLSQFSGTMEVGPHNIEERGFAVAVMLIAFFVAAAVISNITSAFTRLEIVTASQSTRLVLLRQFLVDNQVTRKLAMRIVKSAQMGLEEQKRHTPEQSIDLLTMISEPLKLELHHEIYGPKLDAHPFLRRYMQVCPKTMHRVCHMTLSHVSLSAGDVLFAAGEVAPRPHMYFVLDGKVIYVQGKVFTPLKNPKFFCEVQLWTPWVHQGTVVAKKCCNLLGLSAEKFQEVVSNAPIGDYELALKYGKAFVYALNKLDPEDLTDLDNSFFFNAKKWVSVNLPYEDDLVVLPGFSSSTTRTVHQLGKAFGLSAGTSSRAFFQEVSSTPRLKCWCPCRKKKTSSASWDDDGVPVLAS